MPREKHRSAIPRPPLPLAGEGRGEGNGHSEKQQGDMPVNWRLWLIPSLLVIALDQLSKQWVSDSFKFGEFRAVTGYFNLVLAHNSGAAFSFLANAGGWQKLFFIAVATIASIVMVYLLRKHSQQVLFSLALSLVLGGALGNLIDRISLGYVIDFLDFYYGSYHWPAFNVADMAITGGVSLLLLDSIKKPKMDLGND